MRGTIFKRAFNSRRKIFIWFWFDL